VLLALEHRSVSFLSIFLVKQERLMLIGRFSLFGWCNVSFLISLLRFYTVIEWKKGFKTRTI